MQRLSTQPRRPNLATIVGSGLALVAAGSLLAFSSLAEQAGLQGLSTGGLRPADPQRVGGTTAITIPAPATAPPGGPRDAVDELVRRVVDRDEPVVRPAPPVALEPRQRAKKPKVRRIGNPARVAVAGPNVSAGANAGEWDGPPYGRAYGYHKTRGEHPDPTNRSGKRRPPKRSNEAAPVHARTVGEDDGKSPKPPKLKKAGNGKPNGRGKANGHSKHGHGNGKRKGRAKGHSKHGR